MSSEESQPSESVAQTEPVGVQLRKAREACGFSVTDVAEHQHLRPKVIQAIEDCDYRKIDSELFLKGYVRIYAAQVGLNSDALVAELDRELEPLRKEREEADRADPLQDIERRKRRKRRAARMVLLVLVLAAVVFGGVRVVTLVMDPETTSSDDAGAIEGIPDDEDLEEGENAFDQESEQGSAAEPEQAANGGSADRLSVTDEDAPDAVQSGGLEPGLSEEIVLVETSPSAGVSEPARDSQTDPVAAEAGEEPEFSTRPLPDMAASDEVRAVEEANSAPPEPDPEARLTARFTGDCWVQVTDAGGRTIFAGLQQQGDDIDVAGVAPLDVVFGNASAVEAIEFDGEAVDRADWQVRNNRVALTLRL